LIPGFRFNACTDSVGVVPKGAPVELIKESAVTVLGANNAMTQRDREQWREFTELMHSSAEFLRALYEAPAPRPIDGGIGDMFAMAMLGKRARKLGRAQMVELLRIMPMSVNELTGDYLENETLRTVASLQGVSGYHQGPMSAGTTFTMLHHHIAQNAGDFNLHDRVKGGNTQLAKYYANDVEVRLKTEVSEIIVENARAVGVRVGSDVLRAGSIVSGLGIQQTLVDLMDVAYLDPEFLHAVRHVRSRGVTARVHLALSGVPRFDGLGDDVLNGVLVVGRNVEYLERAYDAIKYGRMSDAPVIEVRVPSFTDASYAPAGKHSMSLSVQYVPYDVSADDVYDAAMKALGVFSPQLASLVIDKRVLTPKIMEAEYGLPQGNVEHAELALDQVLFMRPVPECARHATPIENLYLCGAGTHPGRVMPATTAQHAVKTVTRS
jgi:phytoene dehydrogenase-like protein